MNSLLVRALNRGACNVWIENFWLILKCETESRISFEKYFLSTQKLSTNQFFYQAVFNIQFFNALSSVWKQKLSFNDFQSFSRLKSNENCPQNRKWKSFNDTWKLFNSKLFPMKPVKAFSNTFCNLFLYILILQSSENQFTYLHYWSTRLNPTLQLSALAIKPFNLGHSSSINLYPRDMFSCNNNKTHNVLHPRSYSHFSTKSCYSSRGSESWMNYTQLTRAFHLHFFEFHHVSIPFNNCDQ